MEQLVISVKAAPGGWVVSSSVLAAPLMFLSGARAERQAQCLGHALALTGRRVEIAIYDRQDSLVAAKELAPSHPRFLKASRAPVQSSNDSWAVMPRPGLGAHGRAGGPGLQVA
jgi:hypothetical protein